MKGLVLLALMVASNASAADSQRFVWDITFMGTHVGERVIEVQYEPSDRGLQRVIRSQTAIDGRAIDYDYNFQLQLAARAGEEPASFNSTCSRNGDQWGYELRWSQGGLYLTGIDELGRAEDRSLPAGAADMSTIDLFDPLSRVPLTRYEDVSVLNVEDGELWQSRVRRLGPEEITIANTALLTEGVVLHAPSGRTALWYTADGVPVRYEYYVDGRLLVATMRELPAPGVDEHPVPSTHPTIVAIDL